MSPAPSQIGLGLGRHGLVVGERLFRWVTVAAGVAVLVVLGLIAFTTTQQALPVFRSEGIGFITGSRWAPSAGVFGTLAFIYGTFVVSVIALIFAVPVSLGIALFTTELAPRRLRGVITTVVDLLAAMPSVVFGLWGILVLIPAIEPFYERVSSAVASIPILNALFAGSSGRSFMTAGLIVALMITPIITSISREVFNTVPQTEKDAALALGATRWEVIRGAVLPHSFGGIMGAVMLGLGRALGETIAIALLIGSAVQITPDLFSPGYAMPAVIANQWSESGGLFRDALIGIGVVLFGITIVVNVAARWVVARAERHLKGAL